jgi:choline dehydrogenase-like flavoprotein
MPDPDVLIIGAGPSGAVSAKRLAEEGFRVTVLEQGDWPDYARARSAHPDFELTSGQYWAWDPNVRRAAGDYPIDESESDITALMWNGVGGGTVVFAAHWQRNMPSDFCVRTLDGVADDWPLSYEELEPYYVRVERDWGVSGLANDTAFPPGEGPPMPPVPLSAMGRRVAKAHNDLGWHWWPGPNAIATRAYGALNPCVQRATCLWGCADGAKATVDRTYWPVNERNGVELVTRARVRRLLVGDDGLVQGAEYLDADGGEHVQRAPVTILCANGIGTPRLLLLSGTDGGLANSSGMVGTRLMLHPFGTVTGLFDDDLESWQGVWGQHIHSLEFYETDESRGFVRGAKWGLQPTGGPLSMTRAYPWGAENAIATRPYGALNPCVQRATCLWGCADGAKATVDRTYWPVNERNGVELVTRARVRRLLVGDDGLAQGAEYLDADGGEHVQRAPVTILCANGIGTPRLLLLSGTGTDGGLANSSGLVGTRLMLHPFGTVTGLFDDDLESWQGVWGQHIHSLEFYETDESRGFVRGAKWGLQPTGGPLSMTRAYPWGAENAIWGESFHQELRRRLGRSAMWGIIAEDLPEESNRVTLDHDTPDDYGIPGARIVYSNSENSQRMMTFHQERARESLLAAGAYDVIIAPFIEATGWHILGTCKMGDDPSDSVVDRYGRTHDVPNLFVFDGSIWPTSSGMNPTATIAAMALRNTEHLIEERRDQREAA